MRLFPGTTNPALKLFNLARTFVQDREKELVAHYQR